VYDSYGKKCNSRFLLNYGFIIDDNEANEFPIIISLENESPNFEKKKSYMVASLSSSLTKKFRISQDIVDFQVIDFFSFLRFINYEGEMDLLSKIITDNQKLAFEDVIPSFYLISPINAKLEIKVLNNIKIIMSNYLKGYTTSYDEDKKTLDRNEKEPFLTPNHRNCMVMRMSEKKILEFYLHFSEYCLNLYNLNAKVYFI